MDLSKLKGYNPLIEAARDAAFADFEAAKSREGQRKALSRLARLTQRRSPKFIESYEKALGIDGEGF